MLLSAGDGVVFVEGTDACVRVWPLSHRKRRQMLMISHLSCLSGLFLWKRRAMDLAKRVAVPQGLCRSRARYAHHAFFEVLCVAACGY